MLHKFSLALLLPALCLGQSGLTVQFVKTGLFVIAGSGGNSVLRFSQDGLILVDGQSAGSYAALLKKAQKTSFSEQPVRVLILTDHLAEHTGNDTSFLAAGTQILAQEKTRQFLEASGSAALPTFTYRDNFDLKLGGVEARLLHFGNAHTSGDTVVYFGNLKVVAVGDLYSNAPNPDYASGGSLMNWGAVLGDILKLDFDTVVPGEGAPITRAELQTLKSKVDAFVAKASTLVQAGAGKEQLIAQMKTDEFAGRVDFDGFYAELVSGIGAVQ